MTTETARPATEDVPPAPSPTDHPMSRRSVLKALGLGGATVAVAATGVVSYRVFDNGVLDAGSGRAYDAWTQWRTDPSPLGAVGAAILAANPHNTQPWTFRVTSSAVDLSADPARRMTAVDPFDREHDVGLGCALENLALGLAARGYSPAVALRPQSGDPALVATVRFAAATPVDSVLYNAIGDRHSNRGPYTATAVTRPTLDGLVGSTADLPGVQVRWFTSPADKAAFTAVIMDATEAFIADQGQSEEAFSWFRNSRSDIEKHQDGPTLDAQGLAPLTLALAKILPATSRVAGDKFWLDQTRTVHTATAAAYGVITVADTDDLASRLLAGRLLQRIHLTATANGLGLQHMNQITERIDREKDQGVAATFLPRLQALLAEPGRQPLVAFRVGHPVRSALRSPRRPVSAVVR